MMPFQNKSLLFEQVNPSIGMDKQSKIDKIGCIASESEIHELLADLLPAMGYQDVTITHERGSLPENGKDVVASKFDEEENKKEWYAFVVKKGDIRGTSAGVRELRDQISDAFLYSWNSLQKGKGIKMNKVKAVTNGKFNSGAKEKILEDSSFSDPNLSLWSGQQLVEFIDKHYPRYWLKGDKIYKHYIEIFQKNNKEENIAKTFGITNEKLKKIVDYAIQPKLVEIFINDDGEFKKRGFELSAVGKLQDSTLIVGESGSGKSTFFKQLANDIIYENSLRNDYELYPFIIKFSDFAEFQYDIKTSIKKHLEHETYQDVMVDIEELMLTGNYVLFIDALDELATEELKEKALTAINDFRQKNPTIKIYCSSRPADSLLGSCQKLKFKYLEINNITQVQAEAYFSRYFSEEQVKCKRLLQSLRDSHILDKLPKTPLTLALIAAIFDENSLEIPATISDLYRHFSDILLNKNIKDSTTDLLKVGIQKSILAYLAEKLHTENKKSISRIHLTNELLKFAEERGHKYNVADVIDDLIKNAGLLIENERGEVEFKHLSFQEYFTAYQFYNHSINGKQHFIDKFNDLWWQNVAIFYAGMTKDSPDLIDEILLHSEPKSFREYIINLGGVGHLLQALYNTPISSRIKGIERNIINATKASEFLIETEEPEFNVFKILCNTRYGVFKIMSYWFQFHHNSITLKAPLKQAFSELTEIIKDPEIIENKRFSAEYSAYMIAATIAEIENDYTTLSNLLDITHNKNNYVRALITTALTDRRLSNEEKKRKDIKKLKAKLDLFDHSKIQKAVNIKLTDKKLITDIKTNQRDS